ncbi:hypothetical protein [Pseudaestuariivita sp.]|uniref:hypothetical protein n=1 Tax=Pseudaestuariivita sp. TaxID=2211669 RepID=UPI004058B98F
MVLVSHSHAFIFLKSRKTAGTSVEMALEPFCRPAGARVVEKTHTRITVQGVVGQRKVPTAKLTKADARWYHHMPARKVAEQIGPEIWERYAKITSVRNPYARMVSYYFWLALRDGGGVPEGWQAQREDFATFVASDYWQADAGIVSTDTGLAVTHAVRQEHIEGDLLKLADHLALDKGRITVPTTKFTRDHPDRKPVPEYFDAKTAAIVKKRCAWMFELGGYSEDWADA